MIFIVFQIDASSLDLGVFFFKQKTAYEIKECDWSSDVCSSDLYGPHEVWAHMGWVGHPPH